jgi:hypothetical protein
MLSQAELCAIYIARAFTNATQGRTWRFKNRVVLVFGPDEKLKRKEDTNESESECKTSLGTPGQRGQA